MKTTPTDTAEFRGIVFYGVFTHGRQGRFNALPEDCYPDEPAEFDVHYAKVGDTELDPLITALISDFYYDEIIKAAEEQMAESLWDGYKRVMVRTFMGE